MNRLKELRLNAGLSQGKLAKKMGYKSNQFISNFERGLSNPPYFKAKDLSIALGVPLEEMLDILFHLKVMSFIERNDVAKNKHLKKNTKK